MYIIFIKIPFFFIIYPFTFLIFYLPFFLSLRLALHPPILASSLPAWLSIRQSWRHPLRMALHPPSLAASLPAWLIVVTYCKKTPFFSFLFAYVKYFLYLCTVKTSTLQYYILLI